MDPVDVLRRRITEKLAGRSPAVLARGIGRSAPWISRFLKGQRDMPFDTAAKVATFFGVPLWQLLTSEEELQALEPQTTTIPGFSPVRWLKSPIAAGEPLAMVDAADEDRFVRPA